VQLDLLSLLPGFGRHAGATACPCAPRNNSTWTYWRSTSAPFPDLDSTGVIAKVCKIGGTPLGWIEAVAHGLGAAGNTVHWPPISTSLHRWGGPSEPCGG